MVKKIAEYLASVEDKKLATVANEHLAEFISMLFDVMDVQYMFQLVCYISAIFGDTISGMNILTP